MANYPTDRVYGADRGHGAAFENSGPTPGNGERAAGGTRGENRDDPQLRATLGAGENAAPSSGDAGLDTGVGAAIRHIPPLRYDRVPPFRYDGVQEKAAQQQKLQLMPSSRQQQIAAGLQSMQELEQELHEARARFDKLTVDYNGQQAALGELKVAYARLQAEMETYRADRDAAVTAQAATDAVYDAVLTIMQKHRASAETKDAVS